MNDGEWQGTLAYPGRALARSTPVAAHNIYEVLQHTYFRQDDAQERHFFVQPDAKADKRAIAASRSEFALSLYRNDKA